MSKDALRTTVGLIVIFGHLAVFISGMLLGVFSLLNGIDAVQTLLTASPVLGATSFAAFSYILSDNGATKEGIHTSYAYAFLVIVFPLILLTSIGVLFLLFYRQIDHFGPDQLKIALGAVETFFGVYLGAISRSLFGEVVQQQQSS